MHMMCRVVGFAWVWASCQVALHCQLVLLESHDGLLVLPCGCLSYQKAQQ